MDIIHRESRNVNFHHFSHPRINTLACFPPFVFSQSFVACVDVLNLLFVFENDLMHFEFIVGVISVRRLKVL
jgi:hypothetical protein